MAKSGKNQKAGNRLGAMGAIFIGWICAAVLGDEVVGGILYGFDESFGFVLNKPWWWVYQGVLLALVCLIVLVVNGIGVFRAK